MQKIYRNVMSEVNDLIDDHYNRQPGDEKKLRFKSLSLINRNLESKLKKLKTLYEKKCAQYEAMKEALDIERDLVDTNILEMVNRSPNTNDDFSTLKDKWRSQDTVEKKKHFCEETIKKTVELLNGVKNYAIDGLITGEIMTNCLEILQKENSQVLFVDWTVTRDILKSNNESNISRIMDNIDAYKFTTWFLVINDSFHWSFLLYIRSRKAFFHYDSRANRNHALAQRLASILAEYTDSDQFFEVLCSQQTDEYVSGFHVIENITKLLPILEEGRIVIGDTEITLEKISLIKMFPLKSRILVMKLYLQRKLELLNEL